MLSNKIRLWDEREQEKIYSDGFRPFIETYIMSGNNKRGAVLICPGGGYGGTSDREAEPIAIRFNAAGYHAFVLRYSVAPRRHPQPLLDVSKAMCIIREGADIWNIHPSKIAVCGFSAGGHLAASLGVHWNKSYLNEEGIATGLNQPNALILCYPVISFGEFTHGSSRDNLLGKEAGDDLIEELSLEYQVNEKTPATFLWHTFADETVPVENSLLFAQSLRQYNIPFELHVYPEGPHGLSLATSETDSQGQFGEFPHVASWMDLCIEWLNQQFE